MKSQMFGLAKELFPICRSITGDGNRKTLEILSQIHPINIIEIPSGTRVFDWDIPQEWNIKDAFVKDSNGKRIIDFNKSNLHVVGYSEPFYGNLDGKTLKTRVHTLPNLPNAIPYMTSYYKKYWGLCMRHVDLDKIKDDENYEVKIDSNFKNGSLTIGEIIIKGQSEKEILLSCNICHPSMASNEISGMIIAIYLAKFLSSQDNFYTYRIVFIPETIGAIAYLSMYREHLMKNVIGGYTITCAGDNGRFSYLCSKYEDAQVDRITKHLLKNSTYDFKIYSFVERGSDERQYCYPGVNLSIGSLMRTKYREYPEYHTSEDNLDFISAEGLYGSLEMYKKCIKVFENNFVYLTTTVCEPKLIKYDLYPSLSTIETIDVVRNIKNVLVFCDGEHDLLWIAEKLNKSVFDIIDISNKLIQNNLIKRLDL